MFIICICYLFLNYFILSFENILYLAFDLQEDTERFIFGGYCVRNRRTFC